MWKKFTSVAIVATQMFAICSVSVSASPKNDADAKAAEKLHAAIAKLGTGPAARIEIKLRDKTKVKGYLDQVSDDYFVVIDDNTGTATKVPYPQVKQVKGNNLSTGAKIAIGVVAFIAFCTLFAWASSER